MIAANITIFIVSLLIIPAFFIFVKEKSEKPWLFVLSVSIAVVNLGYLLISLSKTVEFALISNKISYLGQVVIPLAMLMIILELCGFKAEKCLKTILILGAVMMFALVCTTGYLDWYYKSTELATENGVSYLVKVYGPLHVINLIYVLSYFISTFVVIVVSVSRHKDSSNKLAGLMFAVLFCNIAMWLVEKMVEIHFEFLSISYVMSELAFLFVYVLLQDYIPLGAVKEHRYIPLDLDKIREIVMKRSVGTITSKEIEVIVELMTDDSRKDIALRLHVSENTVKTHIKHIYDKMGVSGRKELKDVILDSITTV